jgi:hypothetical protein
LSIKEARPDRASSFSNCHGFSAPFPRWYAMNRKAVHSQTFLSLGYDPAASCLEAQFRDGDIYQYFNVSPAVWKQFQAAISKGQFFATHIRDRYAYRKCSA